MSAEIAAEKLEEKIQKVNEEVQKRDDAEMKKAEQEFRKACQKDTAGTFMNFVAETRAQFEAVQAQLDSAFPIGVLARAIDELNQRLVLLENTTGASE